MKTYIDVPYVENDRAKSLGARWDLGRKRWYVPDAMDLTPFLRWVPGINLTAEVAKVLQAQPHERANPAKCKRRKGV